MANGTVNFRLHANNPDQVDNSQKIEIPVLGPGAVNLLVIYTGTAIVNWDWEMLGSDTAIVQIVLEEDFDSKYGRPLGSDRPIVAPTFLAVSSEASKSPAFAPPDSDNDDWNFQIDSFDREFTELGAQTPAGTPLQITAGLTNDERGSFHRIAYQVSVPVVAKAPLAPPSGICTHLPDYQNPPNQPPFNLVFLDHDLPGAAALEFVIDPPAANGANRLLIFTGETLINFTPSNDDQLTKGTVTIQFLRDLLSKDNLKSAAGSATLTSIFNINADFDTAYAVDCVQVTPEPNGQMILPTLTAAVVVQGQASTQGTGISRLMYQANVEIAVGLQILVNSNLSSPNFQPTAVVQARGQWNFQLTMPTKGLGPVQLAASDPLKILQGILPASWQVPVDKAVDVSPPLLTSNVAPGLTIPVNITASFGGFTSTATLIVKGVG